MSLFAAAVICSVLSVNSGDSMTVACVEDGVRSQGEIHVAGIAAPLVEQPFGMIAQDELMRLCQGQEMAVTPVSRRGNAVLQAQVECGGRDVAQWMLTSGLAWATASPPRAYSKMLKELEQQSRQRRLGLWSQKRPMPPWSHKSY